MESNRLFYRELTESDAERLFAIYSNVEAMKYRQSDPHITIADTLEMLARDQAVRSTNYEIRYGIIVKESHNLIGTVMFQPIFSKAILGYSLDEYYWGKGYASEAVHWILNHLTTLNFRIIEAWVLMENKASIRVLEKNGFTRISQTIYPNSELFRYNL